MASGVSIVIPTWNGVGLLEEFLPSIISAARKYSSESNAPVELIVVDDGSVDDTVGWLRKQGFAEIGKSESGEDRPGGAGSPALKFAINAENLGFGRACNRGFELATQPLVFLLNNDVEPEVDCIAPLVRNFADSKVFAAHCRVFDLDSGRECGTGKLGSFSRGFIRVHSSYQVFAAGNEANSLHYSMFAGGGSAMFDRLKFLEIGGFERLLSPFYWEDVEVSYRAWKRGYAIVYEPRSITRHRLSSTIGKLKGRQVRRIEQRNRLIFNWINLHDKRMFGSHLAWVLLLALTAPFRFNPGFVLALAAAIKSLDPIRDRRREERLAARRTDRAVFEIFDSLRT